MVSCSEMKASLIIILFFVLAFMLLGCTGGGSSDSDFSKSTANEVPVFVNTLSTMDPVEVVPVNNIDLSLPSPSAAPSTPTVLMPTSLTA